MLSSHDFLKQLNTTDPFSALMQQEGQVYREVKRRKTIKFTLDNKTYFAKLFWGVSVAEILKSLIKGQKPVVDASHEYKALMMLNPLGIHVPKVVAYDTKGCNPLTRRSFIVMEAIEPSISLEDYLHQWNDKPLAQRRLLIEKVASITRVLHAKGIQHRDLYICHFLLKENTLSDLSLIDLHRARFKNPLPYSWKVKDLSALYFSVLSSPLTKRDYYRFLRVYTQKPLREVLAQPFWNKVKNKAIKLFKKTYSALPQSLSSQESMSGDFVIQESFYKKLIVRRDSISQELLTVLGDPESIFSRANVTLIKESPLCTLAKMTVGHKEIVIKRYRWKNGWQGFTRLFRPSRAAKCWRYANLLLENHVLTPKPLALVEKRWGWLRRDSYLITEYSHGPLLRDYVKEQNDAKTLDKLKENWEKIQHQLTEARLTHGDTNLQNFLVTKEGLMILDLDTMRFHCLPHRLAYRKEKDNVRFTREWNKFV